MTSSFFIAYIFSFSNKTLHPSSHNCGTQNDDELVSPGTIVAVFAAADNVTGRGSDPLRVAFKTELSSKLISMSAPSHVG